MAKYSNAQNWLIAASLFGFILFYDFFVWPHYVLTDTIYSFFLIVNFWFIVKFCNRPIINFSLLIIIISLLILFLNRPTSIPVIIYLVAMLVYYFINKKMIIKNQSIKITTLLCIIIVMIIAFIVNLNIIGVIHGGEELKLMTGFIKDGVVIHDRPETYILFNNNYISIIKVFAVRFIYFFSPFSINYSLAHIFVNLIVFFAVGLIIIIGELMIFNKKNHLSNQFYILRSLIWGLILTMATFHSITLIDYDWRYRYPLIPLILVLSMVHANNIKDKLDHSHFKISSLITKYFKILKI